MGHRKEGKEKAGRLQKEEDNAGDDGKEDEQSPDTNNNGSAVQATCETYAKAKFINLYKKIIGNRVCLLPHVENSGRRGRLILKFSRTKYFIFIVLG